MKISKKAYVLNLEKIKDGWLVSEVKCYAENKNEARSNILGEIRWDDLKLKNGDEITYLNVPILRKKEDDLYEFEDKDIPQWRINQILDERKRHEEYDVFLNDNSVKWCYIRKGGMYYRPNSSGYTEYQIYAGVYTKEEAIEDAKSCSELRIIPINIEEHNNKLNRTIEDLKSRII